ncbi:MAG: hypothetical protein ACD_78C00018G0001 [uncultured bacterium (gcode 4)]|uniref:Uncharacterized protein n=1 Tax=uncultured bacterium (gcode 4) TaxID=1234023 RepID=K1YE42_9BACT|nr:MAG: hypothetical protein ACD_78C00018G0001 [uncultured bacterium (gcode 4)]
MRCEFRVDATGTEEEEFPNSGEITIVDDVILYLEILIDEIRWIIAIREYSSDFGGREEDIFRFFWLEKSPYLILIQEIKFRSRPAEEIGISEGFEFPLDSRSDESVVSGDVDFGSFIHRFWDNRV